MRKLCHIPRSARLRRDADNRSVRGKPFENSNLINRQRTEKSSESGGNVHTLGNCSCSCVALPPASMQSSACDPAIPPKHQYGRDINVSRGAPNPATGQYGR